MPKEIIKKLKIPNLKKIKNKEDREEAKSEIAEYLEDTILSHVAKGKSPVSKKGNFKALKLGSDYRKLKKAEAGSTKPNLEFTGEMLDEFEVRETRDGVSFGFHSDSSEDSRNKADNHNKFSSKSKNTKVPERRFIPTKKENLKRNIMTDINNIIKGYQDASEDT